MHLTIAIATWNRATVLDQMLSALGQVELVDGVTCDAIVCDNNSTDDTAQIVAAQIAHWRERLGDRFPLRSTFEPTQGKSHALNRMLRETQGDWVLFLDDDVRVNRNWLAEYVAAIRRHPDAACLGGAIDPWLDGAPSDRGQFLLREYSHVFGLLDVQAEHAMTPQDTGWGANMALRRDALPAEPYDPSQGMIGGVRIAGEDVAVVQMLLEKGHVGWMLPGPRVGHYVPVSQLSFRRLWAWEKGLGRRRAAIDGPLPAGRFGVRWWAWRRYLGMLTTMAMTWRPTPARPFYDAAAAAARFRGHLQASQPRSDHGS